MIVGASEFDTAMPKLDTARNISAFRSKSTRRELDVVQLDETRLTAVVNAITKFSGRSKKTPQSHEGDHRSDSHLSLQ